MKNIYNNLILSGLQILAILALVGIMPIQAEAYTYGYVDGYGGRTSQGWPVLDEDYRPDNYVEDYRAPYARDYIYSSNPIANSNSTETSTTTVNKTVTETETDKSTTTLDKNAVEEGFNGLAANALFGSGGFGPSGLIQWIMVAIIILVIVILVRRITGADKKYHSTPLKHA